MAHDVKTLPEVGGGRHPSLDVKLPEVECRCSRCHRPFGAYLLEDQYDGAIVPIEGAGHPLDSRYYWEPRYGSTRRRQGPRTGTGLHLEKFDGRLYVRVRCKCGRNEKIGRAKLDALMFDDSGVLRLRDGALYL